MSLTIETAQPVREQPAAPAAPARQEGRAEVKPAEPARASQPEPDRWEPEVPLATVAHYTFDKETRRTVVQVLDASTHEVIREVPPEEIRRISQTLLALSRGNGDERA